MEINSHKAELARLKLSFVMLHNIKEPFLHTKYTSLYRSNFNTTYYLLLVTNEVLLTDTSLQISRGLQIKISLVYCYILKLKLSLKQMQTKSLRYL